MCIATAFHRLLAGVICLALGEVLSLPVAAHDNNSNNKRPLKRQTMLETAASTDCLSKLSETAHVMILRTVCKQRRN